MVLHFSAGGVNVNTTLLIYIIFVIIDSYDEISLFINESSEENLGPAK